MDVATVVATERIDYGLVIIKALCNFSGCFETIIIKRLRSKREASVSCLQTFLCKGGVAEAASVPFHANYLPGGSVQLTNPPPISFPFFHVWVKIATP